MTLKEYWETLKGEVGDHLEEKINELIQSKQYYPYVENDETDGYIHNAYGDTRTDTLYMTTEHEGFKIFGKIESPIVSPPMIDRSFGIDEADARALQVLSDIMIRNQLEGEEMTDIMAVTKS